MRRLGAAGWLVFVMGLLPAGCGDNYIISSIFGQLDLLARTVPIDSAVNDSSLTEEQRAKLAFVIRARDYAANVVGLNIARNYQTFANLNGESLAWNLSGSRKDAFEPYVWTLPFVGQLPYLGYFDRDDALVERDRLVAEGYDTLIYEVDAYSTLGLLPDPVTSALLERSLTSLADTVFHELTHSTVYGGDTTFDESVATFVGRAAATEFLAVEYGADSAEVENARVSYADQDLHQAFLQRLITDLQAVYASDASYEDKLAQRQVVIQESQQRYAAEVLPMLQRPELYQGFVTFPFNNAYLLVHVRYNQRQDLFAAVFERTSRDWAQTLSIFSAAARTPFPFDYLSEFLSE